MVARRNSERIENSGRVYLFQLARGKSLNISRKLAGKVTTKNLFSFSVLERFNHSQDDNASRQDR